MINLENPITYILGSTGALFGIFGLILYYFPPKSINYIYGYRTLRSMKDQETWDYAQKLAGKWMTTVGIAFLIIALIAALIVTKRLSLPVGLVLPLSTLIGGCILMFIKVERKLKEKFDTNFTEDEKSFNKSMLWAPLIPIAIASIVFWSTHRENKVVFHETSIEITHTYGEIIPFDNIKNVRLVNWLPKIKRKINGAATKQNLKGMFLSSEGKIKLIINDKHNTPFLKIEKYKGSTVYFSFKEDAVTPIFKTLKTKINN